MNTRAWPACCGREVCCSWRSMWEKRFSTATNCGDVRSASTSCSSAANRWSGPCGRAVSRSRTPSNATRGLHLAAGYGSMFAYCREALCLSEHEAYNRIEAARAVRRFPVILELLLEGAVTLTSIRLLAPHLTLGNHAEVLGPARGLSKAQAEELVARLVPAPDVVTSIRKLPAPKPIAPVQDALVLSATAAEAGPS